MADAEQGGNERLWRNGFGMTVAWLRIDGDEAEDFRIWFEGPRHGWLFVHLDLVGMCKFVCRASHVQNDFLGELVAALVNVLKNGGDAVAAADGEPDTFGFRFTSPPGRLDVRCEVLGYPSFEERESATSETIIAVGGGSDAVCRAFCSGLRALQSQVTAEAYEAAMQLPFPTAGVGELGELLGGEFAS